MLINQNDLKIATEEALNSFPGIKLKKEQESCLQSLLIDRKDVLGVLPTGYGKSIIYQLLPKILSSHWKRKTGETKPFKIIVVSPLELIRKQQTERLGRMGIKAASLENLDDKNDSEIEGLEIVFGSAERWLSAKWCQALKSGSMKEAEFLVVDEVHTVETWGTGTKRKAAFRQAFGEVKNLRSFLGKKPVLALTATADRDMRQRLCKLLGFNGHREILISPNKQNIRFTVNKADKSLKCLDWLVGLLKSEKASTPLTIIFCHTISDIVLVLSSLLTRLGNDAYLDGTEPPPERCLLGVYYSATPEAMKLRITNSFTGNGNARVVIASTSLSMGVDFPNVKYVIHFGPGRSLSDHLQQAGRAGRDGEQAYNIILHLGKHLSQCDRNIKHVIKNKSDCVRKLLLSHFTDEDVSVCPKHNCCNRCHISCTCEEDMCSVESHAFDKEVDEAQLPQETERTREVSDEDKECLKNALLEVQVSLGLRTGVTLFDPTGVITHGFSSSVIDSVITNCSKIFTISDLLECGVISSLDIAIIVLEVLNEIFEDITIDDNIYQLAVLSSAMYEIFD